MWPSSRTGFDGFICVYLPIPDRQNSVPHEAVEKMRFLSISIAGGSHQFPKVSELVYIELEEKTNLPKS